MWSMWCGILVIGGMALSLWLHDLSLNKRNFKTMIALIQRVKRACVEVDGETIGACGYGLLVLLGVATEDEESDLTRLADKLLKLRIFPDETGKMNRSIIDVGGEALVVSQFTLLANYSHGNRPEYFAGCTARESRTILCGLCCPVAADAAPCGYRSLRCAHGSQSLQRWSCDHCT